MRSTDERMREVLGRARAQQAVSARRKRRAAAVGGGVLSVVVIVVCGIGISSATPFGASAQNGPFGLMGSVFANGSALGYIVVGLLGIALGVAVTMLAYRLGRKSTRRDVHGARASDGTPAAGEEPKP